MRALSSAWICLIGVALLTGACVGEEEAEAGGGAGAEERVEHEVPPVIETSSGQISGVKDTSTKGRTFYSYYGIPYAKPPLGPLRFKNPEMVEPWEGVRDGSQQPPFCPQILPVVLFTGQGTAEVKGEEDCLFLNVFTPKPGDTLANLPIMVFIHGGGWLSGGAYEYQPNVLLNHDVVLVVVQYRLGFLGFMSTEDKVAPGNLGLKDQTLALKWVQKNAEHFGGDPLRVTLFGESAGAASVHFQVLTFESIGLFHRAILESGSAICPWSLGRAHKQVAEYTGRLFNCSIPEEEQEEEEEEGGRVRRSEALVECLQGVDAQELVTIFVHFAEWYLSPLVFGPRVDGEYLFMHPARLMKEARHKRVELITGISRDEGALISLPMFANEALRSSLMFNFAHTAPIALEFGQGDVAPLNQSVKIFDRYVGGITLDETTAENVTRLFTDRFFSIAHDTVASVHAGNVERQKRKVYQYELHHRGQHSFSDIFDLTIGKNWINHADELPYLFTGGPLWRPLEREEDLQLRDIITTLWTNFAATGNPTPDDSLGFTWEPVTKNHLQHLALKPNPAMEEDYRNETREFWLTLPLHNNLVLNPEKVENLVYMKKEEEEAEEEGRETEKKEEEEKTADGEKEGGEGKKKEKKDWKKQDKKRKEGEETKEERKPKEKKVKEEKRPKEEKKQKEEKRQKEDKKYKEDNRKQKEDKGKEKDNKKEERKKEGKKNKHEKISDEL